MKVCFVGIGSIAKRHISNLREICAENGTKLQIDALRHSAPEPGDIDRMIDRTYLSPEDLPRDYDVIFLTNPTEYHAKMLRKLHNHGKHFFIEKPVTSLNTIDELTGFEYRKDSVYYVACPLRYNGVIEYLKQNINPASVNSARCISSSYLPNWRPGQDYRNTYSAHKDLGGGVDIDLIHEWDYLTYLFGMPKEVSSMIGKTSDLEIDSNDYAIYIARYQSMIAELHLDYFGRKTIRKIELYTDEDTVVGDLIAGTVTRLLGGEVIDLTEDRNHFQQKELRYFLELVSEKEHNSANAESMNDVEHALKVLKLTQGRV